MTQSIVQEKLGLSLEIEKKYQVQPRKIENEFLHRPRSWKIFEQSRICLRLFIKFVKYSVMLWLLRWILKIWKFCRIDFDMSVREISWAEWCQWWLLTDVGWLQVPVALNCDICWTKTYEYWKRTILMNEIVRKILRFVMNEFVREEKYIVRGGNHFVREIHLFRVRSIRNLTRFHSHFGLRFRSWGWQWWMK